MVEQTLLIFKIIDSTNWSQSCRIYQMSSKIKFIYWIRKRAELNYVWRMNDRQILGTEHILALKLTSKGYTFNLTLFKEVHGLH